MMRTLILMVAALVMSASTLAGPPVETTRDTVSAMAASSAEHSDDSNLLIRTETGASVLQQKCCKICTTGKACGNSCINRDYQCHQPPGCACDG